MNVLVAEPGYLPYEKEIPYENDIDTRLAAMQKIVGGLITEIMPFDDNVALVSNDDAIGEGLPFNRSVPRGYGGIFGTFFLCGTEEDHFCALTSEQVQTYKKYFEKSEILLGAKENEPITFKVPSKPKGQENKTHEKNHSGPER